MTPEHRGQIEFGLRPLHQANQHEPASVGERFEILREVSAADAIEDYSTSLTVGCYIGAVAQALFALGVGTGGHDRSRMSESEQLDGGGADAAAAAVNQNGV